ncbi:PTS ascorbate transporter subunit IIC [Mollicutes bacterium LVI A0039]|nr:PTS ascorbate transporter subunit IIC [Mollicutes bacterium LVI A0039]
MDVFVEIFQVFVNKFLAQPALLLGTIVFIGYLLMGKKFYQAFSGFIKAYVGYAILQVGTSGLVGNFSPVIEALRNKFGISAYVIDPYFGQTSAQMVLEGVNSLQYVGYVMLIAFFVNIFLVFFQKQTKIRSLFLTGHIMYQQSAVILWAFYWILHTVTGEPVGIPLVILTGLFTGVYWSVFSNLIIEATNDVTDGAGFTIGHQQMLGAWVAYKVGKVIGNKEHSTENIEMPGFMSIFKDNIVSNVVIMTVFIGIIMIICGPESFEYNTKSYTWATYIFFVGASFAVNITIILTGVRIFVGELTESFNGISSKLLKGSIPAVDCAVTFGFAPNTPAYGFIMGFIGQLLAISLLLIFKSPILILSGFICLFFDNGTIAIYANKAGGRRAATIIPFCCGLLQVFGSALVLTLLGNSDLVIGWMGMFDWVTFMPVVLFGTKYIGAAMIVITIAAMLVVPQLQYKRKKDTYFNTMRYEDEA